MSKFNVNCTEGRKKPARWRKEPRETGLRSIGAAPRGYELRVDGEDVLRVRPAGGNWARKLEGWYWVGMGHNTYNEKPLFATAEEAKADADAYFKANRTKEPA